MHSDCKSLQFSPLLSVLVVVVALAVRLDCNHRYHHNNGEERGRLKCIIKLQREELELVSMQRLRRGLFYCQLCCSLTGGPSLVWSPLVQIPFGLVVFVISKFVLVEFGLGTTQVIWISISTIFFQVPKINKWGAMCTLLDIFCHLAWHSMAWLGSVWHMTITRPFNLVRLALL